MGFNGFSMESDLSAFPNHPFIRLSHEHAPPVKIYDNKERDRLGNCRLEAEAMEPAAYEPSSPEQRSARKHEDRLCLETHREHHDG